MPDTVPFRDLDESMRLAARAVFPFKRAFTASDLALIPRVINGNFVVGSLDDLDTLFAADDGSLPVSVARLAPLVASDEDAREWLLRRLSLPQAPKFLPPRHAATAARYGPARGLLSMTSAWIQERLPSQDSLELAILPPSMPALLCWGTRPVIRRSDKDSRAEARELAAAMVVTSLLRVWNVPDPIQRLGDALLVAAAYVANVRPLWAVLESVSLWLHVTPDLLREVVREEVERGLPVALRSTYECSPVIHSVQVATVGARMRAVSATWQAG